MDTYENNDVMPKPEPEENLQPEISEELPAEHTDAVIEEQQLCQEDPSDGFYHGAGTGTRETTFISPESVQSTESPEPTQAASAFDPVPPRKPGRKKEGYWEKDIKICGCSCVDSCAASRRMRYQHSSYKPLLVEL